MEGRKDDQGKLRWDLLPPYAIEEVVAVYTMGAQKYDAWNWLKGMAWSRVFAAIMRHLWAWARGERTDQESGYSHLAHAAWGCLTLMEFERLGRGRDDRYNTQVQENGTHTGRV